MPNELVPAAIISGDDWSMQHLSSQIVRGERAHGRHARGMAARRLGAQRLQRRCESARRALEAGAARLADV